MPNAYTASCVRMRCCLSVNRKYRHRSGRIQGKWPLEKVTSGGALTASSSAVITVKKLRVTFALDCCDREALYWAASTGGYDSETVQDVMLGAVERRFGNSLPTSPVEWLTDNGSAYRSYQTRQFARMVGLEPKHTAVRSPESNGMAESFVKTMKRDYISIMPKPDGLTAVKNLAEAFEHYNEWHPHSALGYRSPREYLRRRTSHGLSDKKCMEI
jgi:putative transposase